MVWISVRQVRTTKARPRSIHETLKERHTLAYVLRENGSEGKGWNCVTAVVGMCEVEVKVKVTAQCSLLHRCKLIVSQFSICNCRTANTE